MTFEQLNIVETGGMFGHKRRLPTFTIGFNETAQRYTVRDDQSGQLVGSGYAKIEDAVRAHQWQADQRTWAA